LSSPSPGAARRRCRRAAVQLPRLERARVRHNSMPRERGHLGIDRYRQRAWWRPGDGAKLSQGRKGNAESERAGLVDEKRSAAEQRVCPSAGPASSRPLGADVVCRSRRGDFRHYRGFPALGRMGASTRARIWSPPVLGVYGPDDVHPGAKGIPARHQRSRATRRRSARSRSHA